MDKLKSIGFYTLEDARAKNISPSSPMWRAEIIITSRCNFNCPYCMPLNHLKGDMPKEDVELVIEDWCKDGLRNIRFSGGEPTLHKDLINFIDFSNVRGVQNIAISSNGSADPNLYKKLVTAGANDFSISLDACCSSTADIMSNTKGRFDKIVENIKLLSSLTYVTVGVVLTNKNINELKDIIYFASSLGVADIRIISAAQENETISLNEVLKLPEELLNKHPILKYRVTHIKNNVKMRGMIDSDADKCYLLQDDSVVEGKYHFPCVIYLRQLGKPIGEIRRGMREDRVNFFKNFNPLKEEICRRTCLDVCVDFNNRCREFKNEY
jgi:MoaA/NifB/PqqE/SkfB family radical SAM enzyme